MSNTKTDTSEFQAVKEIIAIEHLIENQDRVLDFWANALYEAYGTTKRQSVEEELGRQIEVMKELRKQANA